MISKYCGLCARTSLAVISIILFPASAAYAQNNAENAPPDENLVFTLGAFNVETISEDGRISRGASLGAMRTAERLEEIPVTVSVIPHELMELFQLFDPDEHAAFTASWLSGDTFEGGGGGSRLRGFVPQTYRNGFSRTGVGEVVNIERTEVIKGPMSAMFGQANPGGLINYVTRRARENPSYRVFGILGTNSYERLQANLTGPLIKDKLFYRLDSSYTYFESNQDFFSSRTWAVSGSLVWRPSQHTTLYFDVETLNRYMNRATGGIVNQFNTFYNPVLDQTISNVVGSVNEELIRSGFNLHGPYSTVDREIVTFDFRLEHRFNRSLLLRANFQHWDRNFDDYRWTTPFYRPEQGVFPTAEPFRNYIPEKSISGQVDLLSTFWFGDWAENELLLTFEYTDIDSKGEQWRMNLADRNQLPADSRNINPLSPNFIDYDRSLMTRLTRYDTRETTVYGVLLRDRIAFLQGDLIAFGSLRYNRVQDEVGFNTNNQGLSSPVTEFREFGTSRNDLIAGSVGANYKLRGNQLVAFANMSSSFVPLAALDVGTGELQNPEKGIGYEAGFRGSLRDDRIYWTTSAYLIDRYDIPQLNPEFLSLDDTPGVARFIGAGEERSVGFEFEANGELTQNLSLRTALGYNDAFLRRNPDNPDVEGRKLLRAPEWTASFMLVYRFREGLLDRTAVGFSGRYTSSYYKRFGGAGSYVLGTDTITFVPTQPFELLNRIEEIVPSSTSFDLFIQRSFVIRSATHVARLNIINLFDEENWTVTGRLNEGRQYRLSYSVSF